MGFQTITKGFTGRQPAKECVTLGRAGKHVQQIYISEDLWQALGRPARASLAIGYGHDAGRLLISPSVDGYTFARASKTARQVRVQVTAERIGLTEPVRVQNAPFTISRDGIVVDLTARAAARVAA